MATFKSLAAFAALSIVPLAHAWYIELPACLEPFQPFVQVGCFDNGLPGEKLALAIETDLDLQNMTIEMCVAECKGNDFRYAGLAYYGSCYCGETVDKPMVDSSECSFPCSGNTSETCGGNTGINIYQDPTFLPVEDVSIEDYVPLGCWTDGSSSGKTLFFQQDLDTETMTTEICLQSCLAGGFPFAGTEYAGECYCGVAFGNGTVQADESECSMTCKGDATQFCGGPDRLNLYVAEDLESLQPCGEGYCVPYSSSTIAVSTSSAASTTSSVASTSTGKSNATSTVSTSMTNSSATPSSTITASSASSTTYTSSTSFHANSSTTATKSTSSLLSTVVTNSSTISGTSSTKSVSSITSTSTGSSSTSATSSIKSTSSTLPTSTTQGSATSSAKASTTSSQSSFSTLPTSSERPVTSSTKSSSSSTKTTSSTIYATSTKSPVTSSTKSSSSSTKFTSSTVSTKSTSISIKSSTSSIKSTSSALPTSMTKSTVTTSSIKSSTSNIKSTSSTNGPITTTIKSSTASSKMSTVSAPLCTSTTITPPTCEFGCGKWCASPLPDWSDNRGCLTAWSACAVQVAGCFKHAGWPDAMNCFNFQEWCSDIKDYCASNCKGTTCGGKSDCFKKLPPTGGQPSTASTSTFPCKTTSASIRTSSTTSATPTSSCPVATPTNICQQPTNNYYGYGVDNPVGGIKLPVLTCNNLEAGWRSGNVLKLYTDSNSTNCASYARSQCPGACADSCEAQYDDCVGVYAEGCKTDGKAGGQSYGSGYTASSKKRSPSYFEVSAMEKRTSSRFGESYDDALSDCKHQYSDCLSVNRNVKADGKCTAYGVF